MAYRHRYIVTKEAIKRERLGRKLSEKQIQARIKKLCDEFRRQMGLSNMLVHIAFGPLTNEKEDRITLAEIEVAPEYRDAYIQFDTKAIAENRYGDILEFIVRHELSHCLNAPMAALLDQVWNMFYTYVMESETSKIERMPIWTRK
jgi:hypothetical protein